jgi:hypothetical protein
MSSKFKIKGLNGLNKRLQGLPQEVEQKIRDVMVETVLEVHEEQVRKANEFTDRGIIKQQLGFEEDSKLVFRLFCNAPHAAYLEFGTGKKFKAIPGVDSSQYKGKGDGQGEGFFENILGWVKRKRIRWESAAKYKTGAKAGQHKLLSFEETAQFIYHFILINGTKAQPFFFAPFLSRREALKKKILNLLKK